MLFIFVLIQGVDYSLTMIEEWLGARGMTWSKYTTRLSHFSIFLYRVIVPMNFPFHSVEIHWLHWSSNVKILATTTLLHRLLITLVLQ